MKAKWEKNSYQLYDSNQATTVVWSFDPSQAPAINIFRSNHQKDLSYTHPASIYINESTQAKQDVALDIHIDEDIKMLQNGKIDNTMAGVTAFW